MVKSFDLAKSEYFEGPPVGQPSADEVVGKRHPVRKVKTDAATDRRLTDKGKKQRKNDTKASVWY